MSAYSSQEKPAEMGRLQLHTRAPWTPIRIRDHQFNLVMESLGNLEGDFEPGIYQVEYGSSPNQKTDLLVLQPKDCLNKNYEEALMASPIPNEGTSTTHEYHAYPAAHLSMHPKLQLGMGGRLLLFFRNMGPARELFTSLENYRLQNEKGLDLSLDPKVIEENSTDGWICFSADLDSGFVRLEDPSGIVRPLWIQQEWTTMVFVPILPKEGLLLGEARIQMAPIYEGFQPYGSHHVEMSNALEVGMRGLSDGSLAALSGSLMRIALNYKFENPILGILAAKALLERTTINKDLIHTVLGNLQQIIPGHPDLGALHLLAQGHGIETCKEGDIPFGYPPLFQGNLDVLFNEEVEGRREIDPESWLGRSLGTRTHTGFWTSWHSQEQLELDVPDFMIGGHVMVHLLDLASEFNLMNFDPVKEIIASRMKNRPKVKTKFAAAEKRILNYLVMKKNYAALSSSPFSPQSVSVEEIHRNVQVPRKVIDHLMASLW